MDPAQTICNKLKNMHPVVLLKKGRGAGAPLLS
jgi:hypothetical protein